MAASVIGQSEQSQESSSPAAVDIASLLTQARQAMAANKLQEANALVRRAEAARVHYPVLHFGDTPARVRSDLKKLLALRQGDQTAPKKNKKTPTIINPFAALDSTKKRVTQDPFAGALRKAAEGNRPAKAVNTAQLAAPNTNSLTAAQPVGQLAIPQAADQPSPREIATAQLLAARQALVVGDVAHQQVVTGEEIAGLERVAEEQLVGLEVAVRSAAILDKGERAVVALDKNNGLGTPVRRRRLTTGDHLVAGHLDVDDRHPPG